MGAFLLGTSRFLRVFFLVLYLQLQNKYTVLQIPVYTDPARILRASFRIRLRRNSSHERSSRCRPDAAETPAPKEDIVRAFNSLVMCTFQSSFNSIHSLFWHLICLQCVLHSCVSRARFHSYNFFDPGRGYDLKLPTSSEFSVAGLQLMSYRPLPLKLSQTTTISLAY